MAERAIPNAVNEIFAALTGELEDASAMAASAQSVRNRAEAKRTACAIRVALRQIKLRLVRLEVLLE